MSRDPITLKSGHVLVLTVADFPSASRLKRTLASELRKAELNINAGALKLDAELDLRKIDGSTLDSLKNVICELLASEALETAVFSCLARCTLDGRRITRETFEPEEARGDFLPCALEVIKLNVALFFGGLDLSSLIPAGETSEGQPSG